jgi:putative protease
MNTELLAPAGDMQSVMQAVQNGANAVYMGGKSFGARAFAKNFSYDELKSAIDYAHTYGVLVYITVNTLVYESEAHEFLRHAEEVLRAGADALIMQDVGMIQAVRRRFPDAVIHASTQMHNHNEAALEFAKRLGLKRAVLAREMSLKQIKELKCDIEKEVFVHGALCISYSGQCLFSALTNGRSGNRGTCAQSCRMRYKLSDEDGKVYETNGEYLLSPKDIGLFENIGALMNAGIGCFKIEGRMKSPEYVGLVTKIYARLIEDYHTGKPFAEEEKDMADLLKLFNRGYSKAHLFDTKGEALMSKDRPNHRGIPLGQVLSIRHGRIALRLSSSLNQGDGIKFEQSDDGFICNKIYKNGLLTSSANAGDTVELDEKAKTSVGDTVVKTSDIKLLKERQMNETRCVSIVGQLTANIGEPLKLVLRDADGHEAQSQGRQAEPSRTSPTNKDDLYASIAKLGDTPYRLENLEIDADENIFVAKSVLNALRRDAVDELTRLRTAVSPLRICDEVLPTVHYIDVGNTPKLHVLVRNTQQFEAVKDMVSGDIYTEDEHLYFQNKAAYPNLRLKTDRLSNNPALYKNERLLVTDHGGLHVYPLNNDVILDYSVYALNSMALSAFVSFGARRMALSPEMNIEQTAQMMAAYKERNGQAAPVEAVLWARHELMPMRHCVISGALGKSSCGLCKKKHFYLEDIKGNRFPVLVDERCHSHIFHSRTNEAQAKEYLTLGVTHFRVELFDEDAEKSKALIKRFLKQINE